MRFIYLSPHLDDAVYSCGAIMWEQVHQNHQVEVWTFSTADPIEPLSPFAQSLHARWQEQTNPSLIRRNEDIQALTGLGCKWLHLNYPDCIYRNDPETGEPLIKADEDLFPSTYKAEEPLVSKMVQKLKDQVTDKDALCVPLAVGGHVDHRNVRLAAESLGKTLFYFADFPYAAKDPDQVEALQPMNAEIIHHELSPEAVNAWQNAIACYASQVSSFWSSLDEMRASVAAYARLPFTSLFWKYPTNSERSKHG